MGESPVITVRGLGKRYRLRHHGQTTFKSAALGLLGRRPPRESFWALRNISFEVRRGETLGIIGSNGAGKSTLLGLISGTITPTEGNISSQGRISSLLELGAGFHPDLSGRENIFLNGSILGLKKRDILRKFDDIVAFAELEEFIDMPVKHYSSGMFVRLGFSVAMEVEPDVLIVDEVLSVGDEKFQDKCLSRIRAFVLLGKTLLIVSHSMQTIQRMCDRTLLLNRGEQIVLDSPGRAIHEYRNIGMYDEKEGVSVKEWGSREVEITSISFRGESGKEARGFLSGQPLTVTIRYRAKERIEKPVFGFSIATAGGQVLFGSNTQIEKVAIPAVEGEGELELDLSPLPFLRGKFFFSFSIHSDDHLTNYHRLENAHHISVTPAGQEEGFARFPVRWRLPEEPGSP
jgi:ABC-2 type transport system ATP-binding protein/lipopolysaccharide transport system ATP-binding protein